MEYEKCLVELDEILKHVNAEELKKIPDEIRKAINEKKDKKYKWNYDESKELNEQNINRKTIAMLSYLNMEYLLNKEQKLIMEELHKLNEEKIEKEKSEKYHSENIFNKNIKYADKKEKINEINCENKIKENENNSDKQMVIRKEEKWYKKILKTIAKIFGVY
ncbi:MAG: hypothetical protein J6K42_02675 [Clostridia bacterium]|nr:hypothetical protein [Clostridia bacterium]